MSGATLLAQIGGARTRLSTQMDVAAEGDAALRAVTEALRNALRPAPGTDGETGNPLFEVIQDEVDGRPADRLRFETLDRRPVRPGQPESDVREVAFSLEAVDPDPSGGGLSGGPEGPFTLRRRLDPTRNVGEGVEAEPGGDGRWRWWTVWRAGCWRWRSRASTACSGCATGPPRGAATPRWCGCAWPWWRTRTTGRIASVQRTVNFPWLNAAAAGAGGDASADLEPTAEERRRDE